jgi:hypothetical protein
VAAAEAGKIAQTGLSAQQITALQGVLAEIASGVLPKKSAKTLITVSFPLIDIKDVNAMVDSIEIKKEEPVAPPAPVPPAAPPPVSIQLPARKKKPPATPKPVIGPKVKAAVRRSLNDAIGRMRRIERNEATRASQKPTEWTTWLESFWTEHEERMRTAIEPAAELLSAILESDGVTASPSFVAHEIVRLHCYRSKAEMLVASNGEDAGLAERVKSLFEQSEQREFELPQEFASVRE